MPVITSLAAVVLLVLGTLTFTACDGPRGPKVPILTIEQALTDTRQRTVRAPRRDADHPE